jgi:hypothetical protein
MRLRGVSLSIQWLLLVLIFVASRAEGQDKVPPPTARDLTPDSSMKLAVSEPAAKGTAVLAIVTDAKPMSAESKVEAVLVPNVTYSQAYLFGTRVDAFYWIANSITPYETLRTAPRPGGPGCSAGACGRPDCNCFCWSSPAGGNCLCTQCF